MDGPFPVIHIKCNFSTSCKVSDLCFVIDLTPFEHLKDSLIFTIIEIVILGMLQLSPATLMPISSYITIQDTTRGVAYAADLLIIDSAKNGWGGGTDTKSSTK